MLTSWWCECSRLVNRRFRHCWEAGFPLSQASHNGQQSRHEGGTTHVSGILMGMSTASRFTSGHSATTRWFDTVLVWRKRFLSLVIAVTLMRKPPITFSFFIHENLLSFLYLTMLTTPNLFNLVLITTNLHRLRLIFFLRINQTTVYIRQFKWNNEEFQDKQFRTGISRNRGGYRKKVTLKESICSPRTCMTLKFSASSTAV